jgi:hypothetical protein
VGFLVPKSWRISPTGLRLACDPQTHPLEPTIPIDGQLHTERWRWRWWPTEHEQPDTRNGARASKQQGHDRHRD